MAEAKDDERKRVFEELTANINKLARDRLIVESAMWILIFSGRISVDEHKELTEVVTDYYNDFQNNLGAIDQFMKALKGNRFEGTVDMLKQGNKNDA